MKKIQLILSILVLSIVVLNAQNVGVGTTAPSHKLHIKGQVRIDTLVSGLATDSIMVSDPVTGLLKRVSASRILMGNTTNTLTASSNAITNTTNGVAAILTPSAGTLTTKFLGFDASGNLVTDTAITTIPATTNTLSSAANTITSTVNGIVATAPAVNTVANSFNTSTRALTTTVNGVTGTAVTIPNSIDSITASNGLTLNGKDVRLGGTLSSATTITASSTNTLALAGLQSGVATDSILVLNPSNNVIRMVSLAKLLSSNNITTSVSSTVPALSIGDAGSITLTVTGAAVGNSVVVNPSIDLPNGVVLAYARVSAANTVKVGFVGTGSSTSFTTNFDVRVIK
jgi:hypothetical protein